VILIMNREFLQLAHDFDPTKHGVGGWYVSEKLDGMRAYWDGGITRGIECSDIPFANTEKDDRLITLPVSTGLWSRYAKPIYAPNWFLNQLPTIPLDGELFLERGGFQELISIVKQHVADERWKNVYYHVFDSPSDIIMWSPGRINNPNCRLDIPDLRDYVQDKRNDYAPALPFWKILNRLHSFITVNSNAIVVKQTRLSSITRQALEQIDSMLDAVTDVGGEGLILRKAESLWVPKRSHDLLKVKNLLDSEGIVTGWTAGKGKLSGLIGALIIKWKDVEFELSGFTDSERRIGNFEIGSVVNFKYTEVSKDGKPLKARFSRVSEV
jgi:DNA ligase-1